MSDSKVVFLNVTRQAAHLIIDQQQGKFFTALFIGKDGKEHKINGRTGVYKYKRRVDGDNNCRNKSDLLTAFNVKKMSYRNVHLDGVFEIRAEGKRYIIR